MQRKNRGLLGWGWGALLAAMSLGGFVHALAEEVRKKSPSGRTHPRKRYGWSVAYGKRMARKARNRARHKAHVRGQR